MKGKCLLLLTCVLLLCSLNGIAQELMRNGDFNSTSSFYTVGSGCSSIEASYYESTYGGTSSTNHVAEIDDESCFYQDVCVLPGVSYTFAMDASRRTSGGTPSTVTTHLKITGLNSGGGTVATYVDMDFARSNTTFALTSVASIPTISVAAGSGVVRLRIYLNDNTPGTATLGMIIDNLSLRFVTPPTVAGATLTCVGASERFIVNDVPSTGITYDWAFSGGASPSTSTSDAPLVSWSSTGAKSVSVILGNGVCAVDTIGYSVTVSGGITATRYDTVCGGAAYLFGGRVLTASGIYTDTITTAAGCDSSVTLHLFFRPIDTVTVAASFCAGSSYSFNSRTYTAGGRYPNIFRSATSTCDSVVILDLTMQPIPPPPTTRLLIEFCQRDPVDGLSAIGSDLKWYNVVTGGTPLVEAPLPVSDRPGTFFYYVTQTVNGCESERATIKVVIVEKPILSFTWQIFQGCTFDTVVFTNTSAFATRYEWLFGDGNPIPDDTKSPVHYYPASSLPHTFTVTLQGFNGGCAGDAEVQVLPFAAVPTFKFTSVTPATTVRFGETVQLNALGATLYYWSPADGSLSDPNINNPIATPLDSTTYTVYGYDARGCKDSAFVQVNVLHSTTATIPTAFTPNGDGNNDVFRVVANRFEKLVQLTVYNRWGNVVFQTNDINKGWDGNISGEPADMGVYFYQVILAASEGKNRELRGDVTLIR